ncbi:MAG: hypothetical protein ACN6OP_30570 [Pseudomonadales bacterium]
MHNLYARFVLWLIRPAVERIADERISAGMRQGGALWRAGVAIDGVRLPGRVVISSERQPGARE